MIVVRVLLQTVFLALGQIWANKVRALLTALGIIIGVASIIAVVAALQGLRGFVLSEFDKFGARKMYVNGYVPRDMRTTMSWTDAKLTMKEANLILEHAPSVEMLTPMTHQRYDVRNITTGDVQKGVEIVGIWPEWHEIESRTVTLGRPFLRIDEDESRPVCMVNDKAIEELRLENDPVGDYILIKGRRFLIVGVVETKEMSEMFGGGDAQSEILVPYATAYQLNPYSWRYFIGNIVDTNKAEDAKAEIRFILRKNRNQKPEEEDTFRIEVMQNYIDDFNGMAAGITTIAGGVVSVSLLVGGIGIMNIMLVSVSERTREIGLRKAVGAKSGIVLVQFLVEAVTLCSVGGLIGVLIGQGLTLAIKSMPDSPLGEAAVPAWAIILAFGFSGAVGVVFGMFPALKAARLDPIQALRHE